jgi:hypothetical protein
MIFVHGGLPMPAVTSKAQASGGWQQLMLTFSVLPAGLTIDAQVSLVDVNCHESAKQVQVSVGTCTRRCAFSVCIALMQRRYADGTRTCLDRWVSQVLCWLLTSPSTQLSAHDECARTNFSRRLANEPGAGHSAG